MSGTTAGGRKASATNRLRYGEDYYRVQGAKGGQKGKADGTIKGFAANIELARRAGAIGGRKSRRYSKTIWIRDGAGNE